ncbi:MULTISPECIES: hypothetical protein [Modestobacter]|uniref:hypothetical protein n=1 Tax=Modestobacter TaxID=88138 RepID=UPI0012E07A8B|nr:MULTISPECIES: hypothetical protein [Modestobacter]
MDGAVDVRVENSPDPKVEQSTDALVRVVRACVRGSGLYRCHAMPAAEQGTPMGDVFIGVVAEVGSESDTSSAATPSLRPSPGSTTPASYACSTISMYSWPMGVDCKTSRCCAGVTWL